MGVSTLSDDYLACNCANSKMTKSIDTHPTETTPPATRIGVIEIGIFATWMAIKAVEKV